MEHFHELGIQRLQPMSIRGNEVKAAVNTVIHNVTAVKSALVT